MSKIFKVLKEFEFEGEVVKIGTEIVCRSREAEKLESDRFIAPSDRELDPNDKKDQALLAKCEDRAQKRHDGITAEMSAREEKKNEREAELDAKRAERMIKLASLIPDDPDYAGEFAKLPDDKQEEILAKLEEDAVAKASEGPKEEALVPEKPQRKR